MTIDQLITAVLNKKTGNKDFAMFLTNGEWEATIGNLSNFVKLGEIDGEYTGQGLTAEQTLYDLLRKIPDPK